MHSRLVETLNELVFPCCKLDGLDGSQGFRGGLQTCIGGFKQLKPGKTVSAGSLEQRTGEACLLLCLCKQLRDPTLNWRRQDENSNTRQRGNAFERNDISLESYYKKKFTYPIDGRGRRLRLRWSRCK